MKTLHDTLSPDDSIELDAPIERDTFIRMKCINCGYEEDIPEFVYGEEAEFLRDIDCDDPATFNCPRCHKDTLLRKPD